MGSRRSPARTMRFKSLRAKDSSFSLAGKANDRRAFPLSSLSNFASSSARRSSTACGPPATSLRNENADFNRSVPAAINRAWSAARSASARLVSSTGGSGLAPKRISNRCLSSSPKSVGARAAVRFFRVRREPVASVGWETSTLRSRPHFGLPIPPTRLRARGALSVRADRIRGRLRNLPAVLLVAAWSPSTNLGLPRSVRTFGHGTHSNETPVRSRRRE